MDKPPEFCAPDMDDVAEKMRFLSMTPEEQNAYVYFNKQRCDEEQAAKMQWIIGAKEGEKKGIEKGIEKGKAIGRSEGIKEGKAIGRYEGVEEGKIIGKSEGIKEGVKEGIEKTALNMLRNAIDIGLIAQITGSYLLNK